jgi:hypothetical protein
MLNAVNPYSTGEPAAGLPGTPSAPPANEQQLEDSAAEFSAMMAKPDTGIAQKIDAAIDRVRANPGDQSALMDLQIVMAQVGGNAATPDPETAQKINAAVQRVWDNPGDQSALMDLQIVLAQVGGAGVGS